MEKEPQKPHQKLKKYECYIFTENISSAYNPSGSFLQACINFVEQWLR